MTNKMSECPYCKRPADEHGGINHVGGCTAHEDVPMNRLQYDILRGNLSLAEEGLANYALEVERLRSALRGIMLGEAPPDRSTGVWLREQACAALGKQPTAHEPNSCCDPLDEWRLMEFAPKDGTRILALVTEQQFYRDTSTPNELIPVVVRWAGEYQEWSMQGYGGLRPTLWLPIVLTESGAPRREAGDRAGPRVSRHIEKSNQDGRQTPAPSGHAGLGTAGGASSLHQSAQESGEDR